jgi:hypothetical protein
MKFNGIQWKGQQKTGIWYVVPESWRRTPEINTIGCHIFQVSQARLLEIKNSCRKAALWYGQLRLSKILAGSIEWLIFAEDLTDVAKTARRQCALTTTKTPAAVGKRQAGPHNCQD